eukprot:4910598-Ditylum_brightwellii.AAC.1
MLDDILVFDGMLRGDQDPAADALETDGVKARGMGNVGVNREVTNPSSKLPQFIAVPKIDPLTSLLMTEYQGENSSDLPTWGPT